jgi:predicted RNA-binding protein with EMAP domain
MEHNNDDEGPTFEELSMIEVEEMAEDLVEITKDFIDNHEITLGEFNGLMFAQIVTSYMDQGKIDDLQQMVDHIQKHIDSKRD